MANKGSFLATGQYLSVNDYLVSDNGQFFAVMQSDGNFVLYRGSGPSDNQGYIWSISHTSLPTGQYFAIMQSDGNFVVYHGSDPAHQGSSDLGDQYPGAIIRLCRYAKRWQLCALPWQRPR